MFSLDVVYIYHDPCILFSFAASQFTIRVGEWDLSDDDNYSVELEVLTYEEIKH